MGIFGEPLFSLFHSQGHCSFHLRVNLPQAASPFKKLIPSIQCSFHVPNLLTLLPCSVDSLNLHNFLQAHSAIWKTISNASGKQTLYLPPHLGEVLLYLSEAKASVILIPPSLKPPFTDDCPQSTSTAPPHASQALTQDLQDQNLHSNETSKSETLCLTPLRLGSGLFHYWRL